MEMIEMVRCECCGLKEDCTQEYINDVKSKFEGKWLCGLCSEAVRDELNRGYKKQQQQQVGVDEAVRAHMSFCRKYKSNNPAIRVADGMVQMLRRRSGIKTLPRISIPGHPARPKSGAIPDSLVASPWSWRCVGPKRKNRAGLQHCRPSDGVGVGE